jgi:uncharacterized membrane protein
MNAYLLIAISFALVLAGFLVPFLMVMQVLEPGLVLSFSAYFLSLGGLLLGLYGAFHVNGSRRGDN